jgi:hypothetical protein
MLFVGSGPRVLTLFSVYTARLRPLSQRASSNCGQSYWLFPPDV